LLKLHEFQREPVIMRHVSHDYKNPLFSLSIMWRHLQQV